MCRDFELYRRDIDDYEVVQMFGGGAFISARDVGRGAIVRAIGADATIRVRGHVCADALLVAKGAGAMIIHHGADESAQFCVEGYNARVIDREEPVGSASGRRQHE